MPEPSEANRKKGKLVCSLSTGPEPGARNPMIIWSAYVGPVVGGVRLESVAGFKTHRAAAKDAHKWLSRMGIEVYDRHKHGV